MLTTQQWRQLSSVQRPVRVGAHTNGGIPILASVVWTKRVLMVHSAIRWIERSLTLWSPLDIAITGSISVFAVMQLPISMTAEWELSSQQSQLQETWCPRERFRGAPRILKHSDISLVIPSSSAYRLYTSGLFLGVTLHLGSGANGCDIVFSTFFMRCQNISSILFVI
jgi:hypothetical protein